MQARQAFTPSWQTVESGTKKKRSALPDSYSHLLANKCLQAAQIIQSAWRCHQPAETFQCTGTNRHVTGLVVHTAVPVAEVETDLPAKKAANSSQACNQAESERGVLAFEYSRGYVSHLRRKLCEHSRDTSWLDTTPGTDMGPCRERADVVGSGGKLAELCANETKPSFECAAVKAVNALQAKQLHRLVPVEVDTEKNNCKGSVR